MYTGRVVHFLEECTEEETYDLNKLEKEYKQRDEDAHQGDWRHTSRPSLLLGPTSNSHHHNMNGTEHKCYPNQASVEDTELMFGQIGDHARE